MTTTPRHIMRIPNLDVVGGLRVDRYADAARHANACEGGGALFRMIRIFFTGRLSARHSSIYTKPTAHLCLELQRTAERTTTRMGVKGVFESDAKHVLRVSYGMRPEGRRQAFSVGGCDLLWRGVGYFLISRTQQKYSYRGNLRGDG